MLKQILFILFFSISFLSSQESFDITPSSGTVGISFGRIPETDLTTRTGMYESRWFGINASVPVHRSVTIGDGEESLQQFTINASLRRTRTEFTLLTGQRVISGGWLGGSWFTVGASKEFYLVSGSIGYTGETDLGGSRTLRLRFLGIGTVRLSDPLLMMYGASYSALFGKDLLLPLLGIRWKMGEDWSSSFLLPAALSVRYRAGSIVSLALSIAAAGDRVQTANQGDFPGAANSLQWRATGIKSMLRTNITLSDAFGLTVDLGSLSKRNISLYSGTDLILKEQLMPSRYVSLGLRYRFDTGGDDEISIE
jgi:hypothetical protein